MRVPIEAMRETFGRLTIWSRHHPLKMRVPIEAQTAVVAAAVISEDTYHHPLKMRVPIEAQTACQNSINSSGHHPLKMRVPIEAVLLLEHRIQRHNPSPSENEGPY